MTTIPTDAQVIAIFRKRLAELDDAYATFREGMEATGKKRLTAWTALKRECAGLFQGHAAELAALPPAVKAFILAYQETLDERRVVLQAFNDAFITDFKTALLCDPDVTPEQIAYWLKEKQHD